MVPATANIVYHVQAATPGHWCLNKILQVLMFEGWREVYTWRWCQNKMLQVLVVSKEKNEGEWEGKEGQTPNG